MKFLSYEGLQYLWDRMREAFAPREHRHAPDDLPEIEAEAVALDAGASPTVAVTDHDGKAKFTFRIPRGAQGATGSAGAKGADGVGIGTITVNVNNGTGTPSCSVQKSTTATAADYTLTFSGLKGATGAQGSTGPAGPSGAKGDTGNTGPAGPKGDTGNGISSATLTSDSKLQLTYTNGTSWTSTTSLKGATGARGTTGAAGKNGTTFTPSVDSLGNLSWTNTDGLANPDTVNIRGPQGLKGSTGNTGPQGPAGQNGAAGPKGDTGVGVGTITVNVENSTGTPSCTVTKGTLSNNLQPYTLTFKGLKGAQGNTGQTGPAGAAGKNGTTFTPSVSTSGLLTWTNSDGLTNPTSVNIRGPQGATGSAGAKGADGIGIGTITVTCDSTIKTTPTCTVTPTTSGSVKNFAFKFSGVKGATGASASKLDCWPIGSIYISTNSTSPASRFGGTWAAIPAGYFLRTVATTSTAYTTSGADSVTLAKKNIPSHSHGIPFGGGTTSQNVWGLASSAVAYQKATTSTSRIYNDTTSEMNTTATAFSIIPKHYTVYAWKRTA